MNSNGSLGVDTSKAFVSGVTVDGAKLSGTDNGVRIKTYQVNVTNKPFPSRLAFSHFPHFVSNLLLINLFNSGRVRNC